MSNPPESVYQKAQRIAHGTEMAQHTQRLPDLYALIDQLNNDVLDTYPHIACRTMCNTCCKGTSMPAVSAAEWAYLYQYVLNYWDEGQQARLIAKVEDMFARYHPIYQELHANIMTPPDREKVMRFAKLLPQLSETSCPFLLDEKCAVYPSRPGKCRAHGAFVYVFDNHTQLHACQSEVAKLDDYLLRQGNRNVLMPTWNPFEDKISKDFNYPGAVTTLLVLWIKAHIQDGKLTPDLNLRPDFNRMFAEAPAPAED